jgi:hypothetical protein
MLGDMLSARAAAHRVQRRSGAGLGGIAHRAAVETHALDDDRAIIGRIRLIDARAFVSTHRALITGADAVTVEIGLCFHAERHGSHKRERSDDRRS